MSDRRRFPLGAVVAILLPGISAAACGGLFDFGNGALSNPPVTDMDAGAPPMDAGPHEAAPGCAAVVVDPQIDYPTMCRHYCEALDATQRYLALSQGRTPASDVAQTCYDLRCVPRCVDQALCFTQCDALAPQYAAVCGNAEIALDTSCPAAPADHDAACRAGCSPLRVPPGLPVE